MTVGADLFADAPFIELGTSSEYTPNAGYGLEAGEPAAWGGKTAWWRYTAATAGFVYVDVLHSTGNTRSWSYRSFVTDPTFDDLQQLSAPAPNAQGGFNAAAGGTYWIRVDSDGTNVSYVLSIGADVYDYHTETRTLTGPQVGDPDEIRENHYTGTGTVTGPGQATSWAILDDSVEGGGTSTATMHVETYATEVVAEYPTYAGLNWYAANGPDTHPVITYGLSATGAAPVAAPEGYALSDARVRVAIWSTAGPDLVANGAGEVQQIQMAGTADPLAPVRYLSDGGSVLGDVPVGVVGVEHTFRPPVNMGDGGVEFSYNAGTLQFLFLPNRTGFPGSFPVGTWFVGVVSLDFVYESSTPLPYVPPGPPVAAQVLVLRRYPRHDVYGFGGTGRNYPRPSGRRNYGGQP